MAPRLQNLYAYICYTVLLNNKLFIFCRKAKELIDHIINNIVTVSLPVNLTVESLLNRHGNKIKTIEVGISESFIILKTTFSLLYHISQAKEYNAKYIRIFSYSIFI